MHCPLEQARQLAYWLVTFGCVLALVTAFESEPTGAWHLAAAYLVWTYPLHRIWKLHRYSQWLHTCDGLQYSADG
jgi:hypothetical protein